MSDTEYTYIPDGVKDQEMHERFELFQRQMTDMIEQSIGNLEIGDDDFNDVPFDISPESMFKQFSDESGDLPDERTFAELSAVEQGTILRLLAEQLNIPADQFLRTGPLEEGVELLEKRHSTAIEGVFLDESIDAKGARQLVLIRPS